MKKWVFVCLVGLGMWVVFRSEESPAEAPPAPVEDNRVFNPFVDGNSRFAFDFLHAVESKRGDYFVSPYSISTAFDMVANGAKGETLLEMQNGLHYSIGFSPYVKDAVSKLLKLSKKERTSAPQLIIANAVWIQQGFPVLSGFRRAVEEDFQAVEQTVDFAQEPSKAVKTVNDWISRQTKGRVPLLLTRQNVSSNTRLVITSAIYMKGFWRHSFESKETVRAPFYVTKDHSLQVDMMTKTAQFALHQDEKFDFLELPYVNDQEEGPELVMLILLPKEKEGLKSLEASFTFEAFERWLKELKEVQVKVSLPKFRLEDKWDLMPVMEQMGVKKAFTPEADFSGISGGKNLYISQAVHKTFINVDEKGTEVAGATGVVMNLTAVLPDTKEPFVFVADHPFFFWIFDRKTESILFMGRVTQP